MREVHINSHASAETLVENQIPIKSSKSFKKIIKKNVAMGILILY